MGVGRENRHFFLFKFITLKEAFPVWTTFKGAKTYLFSSPLSDSGMWLEWAPPTAPLHTQLSWWEEISQVRAKIQSGIAPITKIVKNTTLGSGVWRVSYLWASLSKELAILQQCQSMFLNLFRNHDKISQPFLYPLSPKCLIELTQKSMGPPEFQMTLR